MSVHPITQRVRNNIIRILSDAYPEALSTSEVLAQLTNTTAATTHSAAPTTARASSRSPCPRPAHHSQNPAAPTRAGTARRTRVFAPWPPKAASNGSSTPPARTEAPTGATSPTRTPTSPTNPRPAPTQLVHTIVK